MPSPLIAPRPQSNDTLLQNVIAHSPAAKSPRPPSDFDDALPYEETKGTRRRRKKKRASVEPQHEEGAKRKESERSSVTMRTEFG